MYSSMFASFNLLMGLHAGDGDVIITIKSDAEDAFQFRVTGHHSKKDGQVVEQQMVKRNNTDTRHNTKHNKKMK